MDLVHLSVRHIRFGEGVVTAFNGKTLIVSFQDGTERTFSWPIAFERFLTSADPAVQAEVQSAIARRHEEELAVLHSVEEKIASLAPAPVKRRTTAKVSVKSPSKSSARVSTHKKSPTQV